MGFPIQLVNDLVAIQYDEEVHSDILLPDWKKSLVGTVIAIGPGEILPNGILIPIQAKVGDRASFGAAVGMEASVNGIPVRVMKDSDIDFVYERIAN